MTVAELIEKLQKQDPFAVVMLRDVVAWKNCEFVSTRRITEQDADDHADCEGRAGESFVSIT